jgi:hypothetical protein
MLRKPDSGGRTAMATERIVPLDRARTFITLLVVLHHSVVNYTYFGNGDRMRWLGFDLVVLLPAWRAGDPETSWQYIVYDPAFPAAVKFAIVFTGTLSMSWALTVLLRKIPVVARTI